MTEIFTAKTVEEAKMLAAAKFGRPISEITFEILDEGKKGFLGLGKSDAKVKASVADKPQTEKKSEEVKAPAKEKITEKVANTPENLKTSASENEAKNENFKNEKSDDEYSIENFSLIEDDALINEKVKLARDYITSILRAMDVNSEFKIYQNETGAIINIESDNNGTIIGRRGETLDALQYLCSIISNKGDKEYFRITVDCFGYRKKRKDTLEQLAAKVAKSVIRTGRSQPLEPMNPYERRVIHSAISEIDGVSSRSVGEEPYRKIIISSNNPKRSGNNNRRRNDNRRPSSASNGNKENNFKNREPFEPKAIDLSTSFEKDYKKPKPEDSIDGGLYGKIEL